MTVLPEHDIDKMSSNMCNLNKKKAGATIPTYTLNLDKGKNDIIIDRKLAFIRFNTSGDDLGALGGDLKCRRNNTDPPQQYNLNLVGIKECFGGTPKGD